MWLDFVNCISKPLKKLIFCHKHWFSNPFIFATQRHSSLIFHINYVDIMVSNVFLLPFNWKDKKYSLTIVLYHCKVEKPTHVKRNDNTSKSARFENYSHDDNFFHGLGDTHYFVMTAKKESLLRKGVLYRDLGTWQLQWEPKR